MEDLSKLQSAARRHGLVNVKEILHEATILREGREADNRAWLVKFNDGNIGMFSTDHGHVCQFSDAELDKIIADTKCSLDSLTVLRSMIAAK